MTVAFEKLIPVLRSKNPVTLQEIQKYFEDRNDEQMVRTMYRISANLYCLKKFKGAIIRSHKQGKRIIGYQLINYQEYDENGNWLKEKGNKNEKSSSS